MYANADLDAETKSLGGGCANGLLPIGRIILVLSVNSEGERPDWLHR